MSPSGASRRAASLSPSAPGKSSRTECMVGTLDSDERALNMTMHQKPQAAKRRVAAGRSGLAGAIPAELVPVDAVTAAVDRRGEQRGRAQRIHAARAGVRTHWFDSAEQSMQIPARLDGAVMVAATFAVQPILRVVAALGDEVVARLRLAPP